MNCVELPVGILDMVMVSKGILKDLYQGSKVGEVNGVIFHVGGDLVEGSVLETLDREMKFFLDGRAGGGFQA